MAYEQRRNEGSVFKADKKRSDTDRDYNGLALICCPRCGQDVPFWVSGWINNKDDPNKKTYLRLSFQEKDAPSASQQSTCQQSAPPPDDDIPF